MELFRERRLVRFADAEVSRETLPTDTVESRKEYAEGLDKAGAEGRPEAVTKAAKTGAEGMRTLTTGESVRRTKMRATSDAEFARIEAIVTDHRTAVGLEGKPGAKPEKLDGPRTEAASTQLDDALAKNGDSKAPLAELNALYKGTGPEGKAELLKTTNDKIIFRGWKLQESGGTLTLSPVPADSPERKMADAMKKLKEADGPAASLAAMMEVMMAWTENLGTTMDQSKERAKGDGALRASIGKELGKDGVSALDPLREKTEKERLGSNDKIAAIDKDIAAQKNAPADLRTRAAADPANKAGLEQMAKEAERLLPEKIAKLEAARTAEQEANAQLVNKVRVIDAMKKDAVSAKEQLNKVLKESPLALDPQVVLDKDGRLMVSVLLDKKYADRHKDNVKAAEGGRVLLSPSMLGVIAEDVRKNP